jgi:hypothetical protein
MGVMMQAFHWDSPRFDNKEFVWWGFVRGKGDGFIFQTKNRSIYGVEGIE